MFHYSICTIQDYDLFCRQCTALEKRIPGLVKGDVLEDVDGTLIQKYTKDNQEIRVYNSMYVDAVYVESEFDLKTYFPNAKTGYS